MSAPEFHVQVAILEGLARAFPDVFVFAIPNGAALCANDDPAGRKRAIREIAKLKHTGMVNGVPDLCLVWTGGVGWIEVKSATGALSDDQKHVHAVLKAKGHRVEVCRSVDDLIRTMREWGVPGRIAA